MYKIKPTTALSNKVEEYNATTDEDVGQHAAIVFLFSRSLPFRVQPSTYSLNHFRAMALLVAGNVELWQCDLR